MANNKENSRYLLKKIARLKNENKQLKNSSKECLFANKNLKEGLDCYRSIVEFAADAIIIGNPQGRIVSVNKSACFLTGYSHHELLGKNFEELFSKEELKKIPLRYDELKSGKIVKNERNLTRGDGKLVPVEMHSRRMPNGSYQTIIRDYTKHKKNEEKMLSLIQDLEAFTSTVSHDLRTLLSNILIATELLISHSEESIDEQGFELLTAIEDSANQMLELVENLLVLARTDKFPLTTEIIESDKALKKVLISLVRHIEAQNIKVEIAPIPPMKVPQVFFIQIFQNLIGNAIKYACTHEDTIYVGGVQQGSDVRLYVRDHGPGIPEKERDHVFDMFHQGNNSGVDLGAGLGLAIVKKIARTFGGNAWVEETPGGGCTFQVELRNVL